MTGENIDIEAALRQFPEYAYDYTAEPRTGRRPRKLLVAALAGVAGLAVIGGVSFSRSAGDKPKAAVTQEGSEANLADDNNFRTVGAQIDAIAPVKRNNPSLHKGVTRNAVVHGVAGTETTIENTVTPTTFKKLGVVAEKYTVSYFAPTVAANSNLFHPAVADGGEVTATVGFTTADKKPAGDLTYQLTKSDGSWVALSQEGTGGLAASSDTSSKSDDQISTGFYFAQNVIKAMAAQEPIESVYPVIGDAVH